MTRHLLWLMALVCVLTCSDAAAQLPYLQSRSFSGYGRPGGIGPTSRPTFSPYLNLLRGENSTLFNYYGLVRPEIEFRAANQQFQSSLGQVNTQLRDYRREAAGSRLSQSGHQVRFMSDLRGPSGSLVDSRQSAATGYSRIGITGHSAWFGNTGPWYQPFGQSTGTPARAAPTAQRQAQQIYSSPASSQSLSPAASLPSSNGSGRSR
ncbi:MAG: hypothetical protein ACYTGL_05990 [Planctomycetota bacterium]|jgi:hypothetical protein